METINQFILFVIAVLSIINLIIEIEDVKTYKYEFILKICFGSIAAGALSLIVYNHSALHTFLYIAMLVTLVNRIFIRKKQ